MFVSSLQRERGHREMQNQVKNVTKKRRRSLRIFSAHITTNAIEIEFSAALASLALIRSREYYLLPDPKHPSTSLRRRWSAISCCV
jgi:hypothetical protein